MRHLVKRWAFPALLGFAALGLATLPLRAQSTNQPSAIAVNQAKEMAALIEQGQMNLRDATTLAEKHVKGMALEVTCAVEPTEPQLPSSTPPRMGEQPQPAPERPPGERPPGGPYAQKEKPGTRRLVYTVSCFAKDQVQSIQVDGLTKKVIETPTHGK